MPPLTAAQQHRLAEISRRADQIERDARDSLYSKLGLIVAGTAIGVGAPAMAAPLAGVAFASKFSALAATTFGASVFGGMFGAKSEIRSMLTELKNLERERNEILGSATSSAPQITLPQQKLSVDMPDGGSRVVTVPTFVASLTADGQIKLEPVDGGGSITVPADHSTLGDFDHSGSTQQPVDLGDVDDPGFVQSDAAVPQATDWLSQTTPVGDTLGGPDPASHDVTSGADYMSHDPGWSASVPLPHDPSWGGDLMSRDPGSGGDLLSHDPGSGGDLVSHDPGLGGGYVPHDPGSDGDFLMSHDPGSDGDLMSHDPGSSGDFVSHDPGSSDGGDYDFLGH